MITQELTNRELSMEAQEEDMNEEPNNTDSPFMDSSDIHNESSETAEPQAPEEIDPNEVKGALEALLFISHESLTFEKLAGILGDVPKPLLKTIIHSLQADYENNMRGLQIVEVAGGFQFVTRPEHSWAIKRLTKSKPTSKLSRSALETLAIIGYKQPLTRADIERIRGVETSGVLRTLLDQKLVRIVGRQDVPGRPILYGTSKQFLQRFGLRDLRDLPPLKEFKELGDPEQGSLDMFIDAGSSNEGPQVKDMSA
ncbi:MAG: SMC-Scp complex subunit ScpB [Nitrospirales bacterium]|nr:SMC-Scp complex subunit ScpB [Nitrospirales bacterium]